MISKGIASMERQLLFSNRSFQRQEVTVRDFDVADPFDRKSQFNELYKKLYLPIFYFAKTFVTTQDAEDVVASSFLKLWRSDLDYSILPKVKTWLNVCTRNACLDLLRDKKIEVAKHKGFADRMMPDFEDSFEAEIKEELIKRLVSEIEKLPLRCKQVTKMAYLEGMTSKEIAINLGISENTVSNHRYRGFQLLRFAFKSYTYFHLVAIPLLSCIFAHPG